MIKKLSLTDCTQILSLPTLPWQPPHPDGLPISFHFFLAKRLNFFSLSFLAELGSGRAVEEEGGGRLWALAPEGPDASSAARG